jgi:hypothetical protein
MCVATGRDLSDSPKTVATTILPKQGLPSVRRIQFRYTSGAEPNEGPMRPVLSSATERVKG